MGGDVLPTLEPVAFSQLTGFTGQDHRPFWEAFHDACRFLVDAKDSLRPALAPSDAQAHAAKAALELGPTPSSQVIEEFLITFFDAFCVPSEAFFTGYYRPEIEASFTPTERFTEPLFARPTDLMSLHVDEASNFGFDAAKRFPDGKLEAYPTREQIDKGALSARGTVLAFVSDAIEAFMIHVQGSARLVIDGRPFDLTYAGRNGRPYTSIGRILIDSGEITESEMSLERLKTWVRASGQGIGQAGRALLHRNESFIFFSLSEAGGGGPIGGAGQELRTLSSIAIDRTLWPYGLPYWVDVDLQHLPEPRVFPRLMVGQDTGSAIRGPGRVDLFFGTGPTAGSLAGRVRHHGKLYVFLPKR